MTVHCKSGTGPYVTIVDRRRPFTDDTWMLVAIMLDEEGRTWRQMAERLNRDPDDFAEKIREGIRRGALDRARRSLVRRSAVYAKRVARRAREGALRAI